MCAFVRVLERENEAPYLPTHMMVRALLLVLCLALGSLRVSAFTSVASRHSLAAKSLRSAAHPRSAVHASNAVRREPLIALAPGKQVRFYRAASHKAH
jgi:hypothetical protein